jgi:hypothetical protein
MFDDLRGPVPAVSSPRTLLHWIAGAVTLLATGCGRQPTPEQNAADKPALGLTQSYTDPKGRFACSFPAGWHVDEKRDDKHSNVRFFTGRDEIRVIARGDRPAHAR